MTKKVVLRKDLTTRKMVDKSTLIRIVKTEKNEVKIDWNQDLPGRGAYVGKEIVGIKKLQKTQGLDRGLKTKVADQIYLELLAGCQ